MPPGLLFVMASATMWAAVGALATLLTALVTIAIGFVYTKRQTHYAWQSAANARVSAVAAQKAAGLAEENLKLVATQLNSQDRPGFTPGRLRYEAAHGEYAVDLVNVGRGTGWVSHGRLVAAPKTMTMRAGMRAAMKAPRFIVDLLIDPQVVGVGDPVHLVTEDGAPPPQPGSVFWVVLEARDFAAAEAWTYFFAYVVNDVTELVPGGATPSGLWACRESRVTDDTILWPIEELEARAARAIGTRRAGAASAR